MQRHFTLEYWQDGGRYMGRVKQVPGIFAEGATLDELEDNVINACRAMVGMETLAARQQTHTREIAFEVYYAPGPSQKGNVTG
ncbi:MAG: type II toxin-antitoxin system HicB family antitoxin [Pseudomonadota bacterium]|nr:type II toxin-antitoxin system HicB family antitoxin [Pseudomonadota bacterium]